MERQVGVGIVGCGVMGRAHAEALGKIKNAKLRGMFDSSAEKAGQLANEFSTTAHNTLAELLADKEIDVINVCTPNGLHMQPTLDAFAAGKHVLVEKPLEIDLSRAQRMVDAGRVAGRKLGVVFQFRFRPVFEYVKKTVENHRLGTITIAEASVKWYRSPEYFQTAPWRGTWAFDGGGALMNQGIHFIDLLLWLAGPARSVFGEAATLLHRIEVEDTLAAVLRFQSGALGVFQGTTTAFPHVSDRVELVGTKGSIRVENGRLAFKYLSDEDGEEVGTYGLKELTGWTNPERLRFASTEGHVEQIADFVEAVATDREPAVGGKEGQRSLEVVRAIYDSIRTKSEVMVSAS